MSQYAAGAQAGQSGNMVSRSSAHGRQQDRDGQIDIDLIGPDDECPLFAGDKPASHGAAALRGENGRRLWSGPDAELSPVK